MAASSAQVVQPFKIEIPQSTIEDLNRRLGSTRWPDEVEDAGWDYGTNLDYLKELTSYWQTNFDWHAQERYLNSFAHFSTQVDNTRIHFIHEEGKGSNHMPILMLHGWPSSFVQMLKIIPLLTRPSADNATSPLSFTVIAPSLPGYGFSGKPTQKGMSVSKMADLFHTLMTQHLGYNKYAVRGSDLGAGVLQQLAIKYPESLIGVHTGGTNPYIGHVPDNLSAVEQEFVGKAQAWMMAEMAYAMEHTSRPQTLAYGLNDSPVGLAAWIIEKFRRWSDCDGDIEKRFSKDELLTNLTIYWATETINSSIRLYYETARDPGQWGESKVPTGLLMPTRDMFPTPREWMERTGRVDHWREISKGGHFLEWEEPELVAEDLRDFFTSLQSKEVK